jgi:hypothetical protein
MGGTFSSSYGRNSAWRKDPAVERAQKEEQERKAREYAARVTGRRVSITSDIDFGELGTIRGVIEGMLQVELDRTGEVLLFDRYEVEAAR